MRTTTGIIATTLAVLALSSCTEPEATTAPTEASFNTSAVATGCDLVSDMISGVFSYYPHPERVAARQQMRALGDACTAGDGTLVTQHAIAFLGQIQGLIETGRAGDPSLGAWLVNALLTCTTESLCLASALQPAGVQQSLQRAMTAQAGIFAVRTGTSSMPVKARAWIEFSNPPSPLNSATNWALWGAEVSAPWTTANNGTDYVLVYGSPRAGLPSELNGAGIFGLAFDLERFPYTGEFKADDLVHVAVCFDAEIDMPHDHVTGRSLRPLMQRRSGILSTYTPSFCEPRLQSFRTASVASVPAIRAMVRSLLPAGWFRAVNDVRTPHIGGSALDFSPFAPVGANSAGYITAVYNMPPSPLKPGQTIGEVTARAFTGDGTPLENVLITIAVYNNRGEPAGAFLQGGATSGLTREANNFTVTFPNSLYLDKTGGYRICVSGEASGFTFPPVCTDLFHVKK